jgi:hypothetical protein
MLCKACAEWLLGVALMLLAVTLTAGDADTRVPLLEQKLRLVERLLESAHERHAQDAAARGALEGVGVMVASARGDLASGSVEEAEMALDEALRQVTAISRRARPGPARSHVRDRYRQLLVGVRAFRVAFAQVVAEKGAASAAVLDDARLDALVAGAEQAAREQRYAEGVEQLAEAYEMLSLALSEARANETLEHRLVFASPAEEYRYEQERYKSHELLIKLMVAQRAPAADTLARIHGEVEQAMALDDRARAMTGSGDYVAAIRIQEAAVAHLARALQLAGLFVPQ